MVTCSKLQSEDGSVISNESEKLKPGRGLTVLKVTAQQKLSKEETRKKDGESHIVMQIIYSTAPLQTRSGVSEIPKISSHSLLKHFSSLSFVMHTGYPKRKKKNAPPLQLHKGSHSAVSRDGPDKYA